MLRRNFTGLVVLLLLLTCITFSTEAAIKSKYIKHDPFETRFIYQTETGEINLKLQVQRSGVERVIVILDGVLEKEMSFYTINNFYTFYVLQFKPEKEEFTYYFKVTSGSETVYYGLNGPITSLADIQPFSCVMETVQTFAIPQWAMGAVIYQIFPDRFFNGNPANDPKEGEWDIYGNPVVVNDWSELPDNPPKGSDFFGGDLEGIIKKLDYLADLGVQAIYLNPIFESVSNHKYDVSDYLKIDDNFGDEEIFKKLIFEAKKRGIYVIIDCPFNHTGTAFWAFQDIMQKGKDSLYTDWYTIYDYPVDPAKGNYKCWNGYSSLPELNYDNPEVREYILGVARYWVKMGVKGLRLDAPKAVPHDFWQELHREVKKIDPEVLLIGEIWDDASPWINGKEFDSTMNYLYRNNVYNFFIKRSRRPDGFLKDLGNDMTRYAEPVNHVLYNLVSSHDVERILTMARGDVDLLKPLVIFQFTYSGAPAIYYGDEVGMEGGRDPDCRRPMIWEEEKQNGELKELYRKMIHIRRSHLSLQRGSYGTLFTDAKSKILAFVREYNNERVITILNVGDNPYTLDIPFEEWGFKGKVVDLLNGGEYDVDNSKINLQPHYGVVLLVY